MGGYASWELSEGDELAPGRTVVAAIGGGSRYEVFLVWDEELFSLAVAKVLRPDQASSEHALRELGEEVAVLERLAHPVLIRSFGADLEGPRPQVLIEHLEGPSLRRLLSRGGALEAQQLLPLALHVTGALAYMHGQGYVHLDVKPDNIVMGVPPRLIDLSIARDLERAARSRGPLGTDAYMAPEQALAERDPERPMGPPADVFGLGATLYHCISGSRPFPRPAEARKSDDPAVRFPQLHADPEPLPQRVDPRVRELLTSMLAREPAARPTTAAVAAALEPLVGELPRKISLSRRARLG